MPELPKRGRPPLPEGAHAQRVQITLYPRHLEWLDAQEWEEGGQVPRSATLQELVDRAMGEGA